MMRRSESFIIPENFDLDTIFNKVRKKFRLTEKQSSTNNYIYFDTFDWRLYSSGIVLFKNLDKLYLRPLNESTIMEEITVSDNPDFVWNLPDGVFKDKLVPVIEMRSLLEQAETKKQAKHLCIVTKDEKTVLRLHLDNISVTTKTQILPVNRYIILDMVRGYQTAFKELEEILKKAGLDKSEKDEFVAAL